MKPKGGLKPIDVIRLKERRKKPPRPGLWWKVFEDDGRLSVIPKSDVMVTILTIAPLYALLRMAPTSTHPQIVLPLALIMFSMGVSYTLSPAFFVTSGPAMVYGWSSLAWLFLSTDMSYQPGINAIIDVTKSFAMVLVVSCFTPALSRDVGGTYSLAFYVSALAWFCVRRYVTGYMPEETVRTYLGLAHIAMLLFAAGFTLWAIIQWVRTLPKRPTAVREALGRLALVVAGVAPLAVAHALSALGDTVALLGAGAVYVALAVTARLRSHKGMSGLLFPLVLCATVGIMRQADVGALYPSALTDALRGFLAGDGLAQALASGATPLVNAFSSLMGPFVTTHAGAVFGYSAEVVANLPKPLIDVICLYPGIILLASVMGVAVSILEIVRPGLVEAQLATEAAEIAELEEQVESTSAADAAPAAETESAADASLAADTPTEGEATATADASSATEEVSSSGESEA